jgi:sugar phosphate isomerase/epimerase
MDRRTFVGAVAAAVTSRSIAFDRSPLPAPPRSLDRIGIQLYTVRNLLGADFHGTLGRLAAIGYREVEFAGYFNHTPEQVRAALTRHGLAAPAAHVGFDSLASGWEAVLHTARLLGHQYVVCAWIPEERRRTLEQWRGIAALLNQAGKATKEAGLQFAYHNHAFEFEPVSGQVPYDLLLAETDPALVRLELDLFWITYGGANPLDYFARHAGRFPLVHVKDMVAKPAPDVAAERVMVDVGQGSIDWKGIFARAREAGIEHYFVEHDGPADPLASARASYEYLRALRF